MSDTKVSETNDLESESLLSPEMKSNINNCDETSPNEKELVAADNDSVKEESSDELPTNGHQTEVNGQTAIAEEKTDEGINLEEGSLNDATEKEEDISSVGKKETEFSVKNEEENSVSNEDNFNYEGEYKSQESSMDMESESNTGDKDDEKNSVSMSNTNEPDTDSPIGASINEDAKLSVDKEPEMEREESSSVFESKSDEIENESSVADLLPESVDQKECTNDEVENEGEVPSIMKIDNDEQGKISQESKMDVDEAATEGELNVKQEEGGLENDVKASSLSSASSSKLNTEIVVGTSDGVTRDLPKTLTNGVNDLVEEDSKEFTKTQAKKRTHSSSSLCAAEDLSVTSKRRNIANGDDHGDINGTLIKDEEEEDEKFDELIMPPTPPQDDLDEQERLMKIKIYLRLKQELLNEDSKLLLLKKLRQSQLKENISQNQPASSTATNNTPVAPVTPSPVAAALASASGVNLSSNLRDLSNLNLLTNHYQASLSQSAANSLALNFSTAQNLAKNCSIVNNNVAHSNSSHSSLYPKGSNLAHQAPLQAHLPKAHSKGNSVLNSPFGSSLGRSPYNHLNSHLSAPPPSLHGSSSSSKQRSSYDSPNLNTAHSSHRGSSSSSLNRSSMATPPNLPYSDLRQSAASSKFAQQHVSQSASPSSSIHNQMSESPRPDPLLAQRQAANVKQVLRKQLEKMPQPKVPPPEMHFVPNPSNAEFIYYIGLEKAVDYLTGNNQTFQPPDPFECVQCGTDFTPVWKWKDRNDLSKPSVICEKCVSNNTKKLVMDEHTKRINTFSKAYEELEKQMASAVASAGTTTPPSAAISPSLTSSERASQSSRHEATPTSNLASASHSASSAASSHNLFGANSSAAAAMAAAANFGSLGAGALSGLQHQQQAHGNSPLSLTAQQVAAMAASFLPQASNTSSAHQMTTPPAAHSSSRSSNSFASNLAAAFSSNNANAQAQSAAATLALLQQLQQPKALNSQSLLLAQQLQAFSALTGAGGNAASNAGTAAMAQLLGFPSQLLYSTMLAASLANQKPNNQSSSSTSNLNAAAAAMQRQLLMDMLPGASGNSRGSGHSSNSNSQPHHNWKS